MLDPRKLYDQYLEDCMSFSVVVHYDEDGFPNYVEEVNDDDPLTYVQWLELELIEAIEEEAYEYAARLRDQLEENKVVDGFGETNFTEIMDF